MRDLINESNDSWSEAFPLQICGTCKKQINSNESIVDDGINPKIVHHNYCY